MVMERFYTQIRGIRRVAMLALLCIGLACSASAQSITVQVTDAYGTTQKQGSSLSEAMADVVYLEVKGIEVTAGGGTGIVLTKLDGSAKGGIVVSVQRRLGVPVKFVGLGEGLGREGGGDLVLRAERVQGAGDLGGRGGIGAQARTTHGANLPAPPPLTDIFFTDDAAPCHL